MTIEYWLKELRTAVRNADYKRQSRIARKLLWYERQGICFNQVITKIILSETNS